MTSSLDLGGQGIDPRLCLRMGQVFRFKVMDNGSLIGSEGSFALALREESAGVWQIETNQTLPDVRRFFRLDTPPQSAFAQCLLVDPRLEPLFDRLGARLTLLRPTSFVEAVFGFLCSQNNHLARIMPMTQRLGQMGPALGELEGEVLFAFPSLMTLADSSPEDLRAAGFGYRAAHVPAAARGILAFGGESWLESLKTADFEEAVDSLAQLPGVGRKLAECMLLYGAGRTEAVPVDTHLWRMAAPLYLPKEADLPINPARSARLSKEMRARFGGLAGWAHLLLFASSLQAGRAQPDASSQPANKGS